MKRSNYLLAFTVIGILGTLWHFVYEWSGCNRIVGLFTPVNESTWEHLKLLFFPTLIYAVFEYFLKKDRTDNYIPATVYSTIIGMFSTVALFYTYTGILGFNIAIIDISTFFLSLIIMIAVKSAFFKKISLKSVTGKIPAILVTAILIVLFAFWTYNPPKIPLFTVP